MLTSTRLESLVRPLSFIRSIPSSHIFTILQINSAFKENGASTFTSILSNSHSVFIRSKVNARSDPALSASTQSLQRNGRKRGDFSAMVQINTKGALHGKMRRVRIFAKATIVLIVVFCAPTNFTRHNFKKIIIKSDI